MKKRKETTIIAGMVIATILGVGSISVYAEEITINTPWDIQGKGCYVDDDNSDIYHCEFRRALETESEVEQEGVEVFEDKVIDTETGELITTEEPEAEPYVPTTIAEKTIEKLQKQMEEDGFLPSHEDQLLRALLSLQKECELGTEEGAPIQDYELFTVATYEPYTHTDLGTQYLLKEIELAIQECESQKILKEKILGPQYLNIPGSTDASPTHVFRSDFEGIELWANLTGLDDPTYAFAERHMTELNAEKSQIAAEGFKCSLEGKQRGLCVKARSDQIEPVPKDYISQAGKAMLNQWEAYKETGVTGIPKQDPGAEPDLTVGLEGFANASGLTDEEIQDWLDKRKKQNEQ